MHFASMSLGIFDFLIDWLTEFLLWLVGLVFDLIGILIANIFYGVAISFLNLIDTIQQIFRKLCGMDVYWVGNVATEGTDPLLSLITDQTVVQILIALTLVAVVMVVVAAIIQIIRTEFSTEGSKNSKGQIFGQALKSLLMFFLVPVCCIGGIGLSNALLKTVDAATTPQSSSGASTIGASIYVAAVYGTNLVRNGENVSQADLESIGINVQLNDTTRMEVANLIDNAFRGNSVLYENNDTARKFYNINDINFILFIGGGVLAAYIMLMAAFGIIIRLIKGVVLFMVSPPMVALMPLDGGSAFKRWRENFLKQVLAAYGSIIGLNLLFLLLPVLANINLFDPSTSSGGNANAFVQMLFTLSGLLMFKDISLMIANMVGAEDASSTGAGAAQKVLGAATKVGTVAVGGALGLGAKGVGAMAGGISKKLGDSKAGAAFGAISNTVGGFGNKSLQKAKGTAGSALNKVASTATGGVSKGPFSGETDYDRAKKAKADKAEAKAERMESGKGTIGDYLGNTIKAGANIVAGSAVRLDESRVHRSKMKSIDRQEEEEVTKLREEHGHETGIEERIEKVQAKYNEMRTNENDRHSNAINVPLRESGEQLLTGISTGGASFVEARSSAINQSKANQAAAAAGLESTAAGYDKTAKILEKFVNDFTAAQGKKDVDGVNAAINALSSQGGDIKDIESILQRMLAFQQSLNGMTAAEKQAHIANMDVASLTTQANQISSDATTKASEIRAAISGELKVDASGNSTGKVDLSGDALEKVYDNVVNAVTKKGVKLSPEEITKMKKELAEATEKKLKEALEKKKK